MPLDAIPTAWFVLDRRHRALFVSDAFCELVGRPREELPDHAPYQVPGRQRAEFFRVDDECSRPDSRGKTRNR